MLTCIQLGCHILHLPNLGPRSKDLLLPPPTISKAEKKSGSIFFRFIESERFRLTWKPTILKPKKIPRSHKNKKQKTKKKLPPRKRPEMIFGFSEKKLGSNFSTPVLKFKNPGKMESTEVCLKKNCVNAARTSDPKSNKQNNKTISDILTEKNSKFVVLF